MPIKNAISSGKSANASREEKMKLTQSKSLHRVTRANRSSLFSSSSSHSDSDEQKSKKHGDNDRNHRQSQENSPRSTMSAIHRVFHRKSKKPVSTGSRRHTMPDQKLKEFAGLQLTDKHHKQAREENRLGLFEGEDDNDSIEILRERAKVRSAQKKNEIVKLHVELHAALDRTIVLEQQLAKSLNENTELKEQITEKSRELEKSGRQMRKRSAKSEALLQERDLRISELESQVLEKSQIIQQQKDMAAKLMIDNKTRIFMTIEDSEAHFMRSSEKLLERFKRAEDENKILNLRLSNKETVKIRRRVKNGESEKHRREFSPHTSSAEPEHRIYASRTSRDTRNKDHGETAQSQFDDAKAECKVKYWSSDDNEENAANGASMNFFENVSVRLKRQLSPQNIERKATLDPYPSSRTSNSQYSTTFRRRRPKVHSLKAAQTNIDLESSDSLFGSDSLSSPITSEQEDSNTTHQDSPLSPPPPPPPPVSAEARNPSVGNSSISSSSSSSYREMYTQKEFGSARTSEHENVSKSLGGRDDRYGSNGKNHKSSLSSLSDVEQDHLCSDSRRHSFVDSSPMESRDKEGKEKTRMNKYMEKRARKEKEKMRKEQEKTTAESRQKEEYEKEWQMLAQEERERKKRQQHRRSRHRRPASMKSTRFSQVKQHFEAHQQSHVSRQHSQQKTSLVDEQKKAYTATNVSTPATNATYDDQVHPLAPVPMETDLLLRQQARLRERHQMEAIKRKEAHDADAIRGDIHQQIENWAYEKTLLNLILTLDQISPLQAIKESQLLVAQSPTPENMKKAYRYVQHATALPNLSVIACRNIIRVFHPDKLRDVTIAEQLRSNELFMVFNRAFDLFKSQS